jgi:hypothetical protein
LLLTTDLQEKELSDGKLQRLYGNGTTLCWFRNGTIKERDGKRVKLYFENGDYKEVGELHVKYYILSTKTSLMLSLPTLEKLSIGLLSKRYSKGP